MQSKCRCTCMYLFSAFLMCECQKRKLSTDLNYFLSKQHFEQFLFKTKGRLRWHFSILNWKLFSTLQILITQINYNDKITINYLEEEDFTTLFFWFKMTITTLASKTTVRLSYYLQRRNVNDEKYKKKITIPSDGGWIMQRKMVSSKIY